MENDLHLKVCLRALASLGQWPLRFKKYLILNYLHIIYSILVSVYFIYFVITEYIHIGRHLNDNFLEIVNNLGVSLPFTLTIYKVYIIRGRAMSKYVEQIRTIEKIIMTSDDDEMKKIYMKHVQWNSTLSMSFIKISGTTLTTFFIKPLIIFLTDKDTFDEGDKPLPFVSWFPFNRNYYYGLAYGMQVFAGVIGAFLTCHTDIFYWAVIIFPIGQIKILQHKFRTVHRDAQRLVDNGKMNMDQAVSHCVRKCILLHQLIIRFVTGLDDNLKWLMLMDFAICTLQIAVIGFQIVVSGFGIDQLFAIEFLIAMIVQLFFFYWHANELTLESLAIASSIWDSNFYEYPQSIQKSLQFVMLRAQKPLNLNVGPFYAMSTATAISIMRAAYSYVALMRQMYK